MVSLIIQLLQFHPSSLGNLSMELPGVTRSYLVFDLRWC